MNDAQPSMRMTCRISRAGVRGPAHRDRILLGLDMIARKRSARSSSALRQNTSRPIENYLPRDAVGAQAVCSARYDHRRTLGKAPPVTEAFFLCRLEHHGDDGTAGDDGFAEEQDDTEEMQHLEQDIAVREIPQPVKARSTAHRLPSWPRRSSRLPNPSTRICPAPTSSLIRGGLPYRWR